MNLLIENWLPVRTRDGHRTWVSPADLSRSDLVAFDAMRPDFNGALAQLAIGLLQTTSPAETSVAWGRLLKTPPDQATLHDWFAPHRPAFEWDGDGARFMQDFDLRTGTGETQSIAGLLIETPGDNTVKNNADLFVKRGQVGHLCPHCAALALFTLQLNAPAGGAGHRTSLRGGGPLTTLLIAEARPAETTSLWHSLWLNVLPQRTFEAHGGGSDDTAAYLKFPWLASVQAIQADGAQTTAMQVHAAHVFWAMPRRIRLDLEDVSAGLCDLCGRESAVRIQRYLTRPQGLNYKGAWSHPLSPYYQTKEGMLPLHPQPGGLGYRHWLGWVLGMQNDKRKIAPAAVVGTYFGTPTEQRTGLRLRLWAFGFDMDNMKARCWYESTLPLYELGDCTPQAQTQLRDDVGAWLDAAELVASYLRGAVKEAWFSHDARGDLSFVDASFWSATEAAFYQLLRDRIHAVRQTETTVCTLGMSEQWRNQLTTTASRLFDLDLVGSTAIERQNPARIAKARRQFVKNLAGPKLRTVLALPVPATQSKTTIKKAT
ncbi:type I-E CRISPR-associated protein Cse1/CasA [Giesbergeria anulus]|uniref:CRISPR system Cascade subunit CasA n=1 Tax=Giesbergeria anulus TaxID=180197 RepID=A0A1H9DPR7_9BURK|nr:type I-E CRISPR-associated protein Cse1/CasA [Giesbergeria anulus]SEQ15297.1 CRISPR system Cascade subunit CasA [Giesbergeria anulus]